MKEQFQQLGIKERVALGIGAATTLFAGIIYVIGPERVGEYLVETFKDPCLNEDTQELIKECKDQRNDQLNDHPVPVSFWN